MKKFWKIVLLWTLALCLLGGCGSVEVQPERQPLQPPVAPNLPVTPAEPTEPVLPGDPLGSAEPPISIVPTDPAEPAAPENQTTPAEPVAPVEPQQPQPEPPAPVPPEEQQTTDNKLTCTLEIRCDTILNNTELLNPDKAELVPADGVLFTAAEVEFFEGESVFNVLQRTLKQQKQHLEFAQSPIYNSAYIEGICNLYNFDCGPLSGWMYRVNDWYPNYGCSQYQLQSGDHIVWDFTCDLGADLGVEDAGGNNQ